MLSLIEPPFSTHPQSQPQKSSKQRKDKSAKILNLTPLRLTFRVKKEEKMAKTEEKPASAEASAGEKETAKKEDIEEKETLEVTKAQSEEEATEEKPTEKEPSEEEPAEEEPVEGKPTEEEPASPAGGPVEEPVVSPSFISRLAPVDKKKFIFIGLIIFVVLGVIAGGIFVYKRAMGKKETAPVVPKVSPSPTSVETPEASPAPEIKREDLKLQVLNGSGVAGAAGEAKELLEGLGYQNIETGNADSYDYEETEISIKEDKEDYLEMLRDDLADKYTLSTESATLEEESEFDAVVIIGSK